MIHAARKCVLGDRETCPGCDLLKTSRGLCPFSHQSGLPPRTTSRTGPIDLTEDMVIEVARRLSEGLGTGETDSISLQHWLMRFREAICGIRLVVAEFA